VATEVGQGAARRAVMAKIIRCECGFVARGDSDEKVIETIRGHMRTDHPALLDSVSREDLLGWMQVE
jgi:predicted small metal-binding protein